MKPSIFYRRKRILWTAAVLAVVALSGYAINAVETGSLSAHPGKPSALTGFGPNAFAGPPATMAESSPAKAPGRVTVPPASIRAYEFAVK
jgi:hypothetical protein